MKPTAVLTVSVLVLGIRPVLAQRAQLTPSDTGHPITIALSDRDQNTEGFRLITITAEGHTTQIPVREPVVCTDKNLHETLRPIEGANLDPSGCFLRAEYGSSTSRHTLLFFSGYGYASSAAPALVLGFRADGAPFKALEREEFDISAVKAGGRYSTLIVGKPSLSEVIATDPNRSPAQPYATTYDPFVVYVVSPDLRATYSLAETRRYNLQHYVWQGPHPRVNYVVLYNVPGRPKPFGLPENAARSLLEHTQASKQ